MKYNVIAPLKRDGKLVKVGAPIELDENAAAALLRDGFIGIRPADAKADKKADGKDAGK